MKDNRGSEIKNVDQQKSRVFLKLTHIVKENSEIAGQLKKLTMETNLKDLGIDSISFVKIVVAIETEFEIEFEDEQLDANEFTTLSALVAYVESKI